MYHVITCSVLGTSDQMGYMAKQCKMSTLPVAQNAVSHLEGCTAFSFFIYLFIKSEVRFKNLFFEVALAKTGSSKNNSFGHAETPNIVQLNKFRSSKTF